MSPVAARGSVVTLTRREAASERSAVVRVCGAYKLETDFRRYLSVCMYSELAKFCFPLSFSIARGCLGSKSLR
jgi:hypothetical protein